MGKPSTCARGLSTLKMLSITTQLTSDTVLRWWKWGHKPVLCFVTFVTRFWGILYMCLVVGMWMSIKFEWLIDWGPWRVARNCWRHKKEMQPAQRLFFRRLQASLSICRQLQPPAAKGTAEAKVLLTRKCEAQKRCCHRSKKSKLPVCKRSVSEPRVHFVFIPHSSSK